MEDPSREARRQQEGRTVKIVDTTGAALTVYLTPDDCLLLADACRHAAQAVGEDGTALHRSATVACLYDVLVHCFEGYALVGQAIASLAPKERDGFTLAAIRREWSVMPCDVAARDRGGK